MSVLPPGKMQGFAVAEILFAPFNGALYIMGHHLMVRFIVSRRHFLTLHKVCHTFFDTTYIEGEGTVHSQKLTANVLAYKINMFSAPANPSSSCERERSP